MIKELLGITVGIGLGLAASRWIYKSLRGERSRYYVVDTNSGIFTLCTE